MTANTNPRPFKTIIEDRQRSLATDEAEIKVEALTKENRELRRNWCYAYAGARGYYDDGEASDSSFHPGIDFLRDSVADIQKKMKARREISASSKRELSPAEIERVLHFAYQWGTLQPKSHPSQEQKIVFDLPLRAYLFAKYLMEKT